MWECDATVHKGYTSLFCVIIEETPKSTTFPHVVLDFLIEQSKVKVMIVCIETIGNSAEWVYSLV